jgi:hypothetical protein
MKSKELNLERIWMIYPSHYKNYKHLCFTPLDDIQCLDDISVCVHIRPGLLVSRSRTEHKRQWYVVKQEKIRFFHNEKQSVFLK